MYRLPIPLIKATISIAAVFCLFGCAGSSSGDGDGDNSAEAADLAALDDAVEEGEAGKGGTGTLVINEIVAKAAGGGPDWIELYVVSGGNVNLGDYSLTDDKEGREKAPLPDITLAVGEFAVIQAMDDPPVGGYNYVPFQLGADDAVFLYNGDTVVDSLDWEDGDAPKGYGFGRLPDGSGAATLLTPTPGTANVAGTYEDDEDVPRPDGWEEESHSDTAEPNYDVVFEEGTVLRMDITIDAQDWQDMLDELAMFFGEFGGGMSGDIGVGHEPMWVPCDVVFQGKQWYHVGIRFKGNLSLEYTWGEGSYKLPFRFDFDEFEDVWPEIDDQRFYGFKKLSLSNSSMDDSLIREKIVADIFRDAGEPAPRTAFYRLFIDTGEGPTYFGLYTMVEIPEKPMLEEQFSGSGGNLYKPEGNGAKFVFYEEASFVKKTNEEEADYSDVKSLYDALHASRADAAAWRSCLESTLNVNGFIRWLAVNTVVQNPDTYGKMPHNYFLYNDPYDGLLHWIPWDNDQALSDSGMEEPFSLSLAEVESEWPLIRYLMDDPVYHAVYVAEMQDFITYVFYPERMQPIYQSAYDLISPYVVGDEGEVDGYTLLTSPGSFENELVYLNFHVTSRYNDAIDFVEGD